MWFKCADLSIGFEELLKFSFPSSQGADGVRGLKGNKGEKVGELSLRGGKKLECVRVCVCVETTLKSGTDWTMRLRSILQKVVVLTAAILNLANAEGKWDDQEFLWQQCNSPSSHICVRASYSACISVNVEWVLCQSFCRSLCSLHVLFFITVTGRRWLPWLQGRHGHQRRQGKHMSITCQWARTHRWYLSNRPCDEINHKKSKWFWPYLQKIQCWQNSPKTSGWGWLKALNCWWAWPSGFGVYAHLVTAVTGSSADHAND